MIVVNPALRETKAFNGNLYFIDLSIDLRRLPATPADAMRETIELPKRVRDDGIVMSQLAYGPRTRTCYISVDVQSQVAGNVITAGARIYDGLTGRDLKYPEYELPNLPNRGALGVETSTTAEFPIAKHLRAFGGLDVVFSSPPTIFQGTQDLSLSLNGDFYFDFVDRDDGSIRVIQVNGTHVFVADVASLAALESLAITEQHLVATFADAITRILSVRVSPFHDQSVAFVFGRTTLTRVDLVQGAVADVALPDCSRSTPSVIKIWPDNRLLVFCRARVSFTDVPKLFAVDFE